MATAWTGREEKDCTLIYSDSGLQAAMDSTGRTKYSVLNKMRELGKFKPSGYDVSRNLKSIVRKFYAEDVARMFEFSDSGIKSSVIAEYFNSTSDSIRSTMKLARKNGMNTYPMRNI